MPDSHEPARPDYLTVPQVAQLLDVNETTVRRWIKAGLLAAKRTSPGRGDYRIERAAVEQFDQARTVQ